MNLIIDTNILVQALIAKDNHFWQIFKEHLTYAPELIFAELGHAFLKYIRIKAYDPGEAQLNYEIAQQLVKHPLPRQQAYTSVFDLAQKHQLSFYDAIYLQLAMEHQYPLVTLDKKLANAARVEKILFEI